MSIPFPLEGILLGGAVAKASANKHNNRLPYNARPIVIVTADKKMQIRSLVMQILKKLTYWNNGKEPLVASVIRCEAALHSTLDRICIYNNRTSGSILEDIDFLTGNLKGVLKKKSSGLVFNIQEVKENKLNNFLTDDLLEHGCFISLDLETSILSVFDNNDKSCRMTKGIEMHVNSLFAFFEEQATWLNPCVIFISSGMIEKTVSTELLAWKNRSNHTFRLFMMGRGLSYDLKTTFSEKNIDELAKAVVQYVEPKPIPRVKKKSVGDCLAIQLPVLEGAMYDNN